MLVLAVAKTRTGTTLGKPVLLTEGRVTLVDAFLAGSVLLGLVLNAVLGWWWADPFRRNSARLLRRPGSPRGAAHETPALIMQVSR